MLERRKGLARVIRAYDRWTMGGVQPGGHRRQYKGRPTMGLEWARVRYTYHVTITVTAATSASSHSELDSILVLVSPLGEYCIGDLWCSISEELKHMIDCRFGEGCAKRTWKRVDRETITISAQCADTRCRLLLNIG